MPINKRSTLGGATLVGLALLFIGLTVLFNHALRGWRLDLTENRLYTTAPGTDRILASIKEPINLYFFYSEKTAQQLPQLKTYGTRVREFLEELVGRSNGKLVLHVIDPQPFSEEEDRAAELGVRAVPVGAASSQFYFGLAGTNSTDGHAAIEMFDPAKEQFLEYDVIKLVYQLANPKKPVVAWLSTLPMDGSPDPQTGRTRDPWMVFNEARQLFEVRPLAPTATRIDPDVNVLVLVHPKGLSPTTQFAIDQFALRGGRVLVFVDPDAQADQSAADPNNPMAQFMADKSSHFEPLLAAWGVDFKSGQVVVDLERGMVVSMRQGEPPLQHIAVLGLDGSSMAKDVVTAQLDSVYMITAGSLSAVAGTKLKIEPLIKTSSQAGLIPAQRVAMATDPRALRDGFKPSGEQMIAVRVSGNATTAFPDGPPAGVTAAPDALKASAKPLNVVVIADTDMLSDYVWVRQSNFFGQVVVQPVANNGELVWNAIDNLGGSNDLISIRGRAPYSRPFGRVNELRRNADAQLRTKEEQLQKELEQTEATLSKLQTGQPEGGNALLSNDQAREIERFQEQKLRIRKELRATKAGLEQDIETLGWKMKLINMLTMPLIVTALGLLVALWRKRRRHAIAMLRKGGAA
jgi:ABC-type uncharacterized transport system involved in gliding motility auxiliary subunit